MTNSRRLAGLCVLAFAAAVAGHALADSVADGNAGLEALNRGDTAEAIRMFTLALKAGDMAPEDQEFAYLNRAKAYSGKGDYVAAIADLHQAIRLKPDDGEARTALQAALDARRAQAAPGASAPAAPAAMAMAPASPPAQWGLLSIMAGRYWACTRNGAVADYVAWGQTQAQNLAMAQVDKGGAMINATYKLDPVSGLVFGLTYKGDAIYGVADSTAESVTESYAMHGVPIRATLRRLSNGHVAETSEAYRNGAWAPLEAEDCQETTAADTAKTRWARKLQQPR